MVHYDYAGSGLFLQKLLGSMVADYLKAGDVAVSPGNLG